MSVFVGMPCYNGEETVAGVIARVKKQRVAGIWVVNDGSTDRSFALLKKTSGIVLLNHPKNRGLGGATKTLFDAFKKAGRSGDWLVLIHSDGQTLPEEIPAFARRIKKGGCDIVLGSRALGDTGQMPKFKKFGDRVMTGIQNWAFGLDLSTYASGFRAFSWDALHGFSYAALDERHNFDTEVVVAAREAGLRIAEIPVTPVYHDEVSNYDMIEYLLKVVGLSLRYKFTKKMK